MKNVIGVLSILIILTIGVFIWTQRLPSRQFAGNLLEAHDNSISAEGTYIVDGNPTSDLVKVEIKVDESTRIIKRTFKIPNEGGPFKVDDLPKKEQDVDFDAMKKDSELTTIGLKVLFKKNLLGAILDAEEIKYTIPEF